MNIIKAIELNDLNKVKELIKDVDINKEYEDNTALTWACIYNRLDIVKELLESCAIVNLENKDGYTALIWASKKGYLDIVEELLKYGANYNMKNEYGNTARDYNKQFWKSSVVKKLTKRKKKYKTTVTYRLSDVSWYADEGLVDYQLKELKKMIGCTVTEYILDKKYGDKLYYLSDGKCWNEYYLELKKID